MNFEDNDNLTGHFDIIPQQAFSLYEDSGERYIYQYCENDLSDEIVGMWVCNETPSAEKNDMLIMTYNADGTTLFTGYSYEADVFSNNVEASYKVIGDLLIHKQPDIAVEYGLAQYNAMRVKYIPNGTALGDIKTLQAYAKVGENYVETNTTWLRVKQSLDFSHNVKYDYSSSYVTNVKGKDEEIEFAGTTINFNTLNGEVMDKMLKNILFSVSFPEEGKISYNCFFEGGPKSIDAPIKIEGNKMTIEMSKNNAIYRDVDVYAFQDVDGCQLHMYMPTKSFENFVANVSVVTMAKKGKLDLNDAAAVAEVFTMIENAIDSINISIIFKTATRSL
jgi:hypothetical protein